MSYQTRVSTKKSSFIPTQGKFSPPPVLQPKTEIKPDAKLPEWKPGGGGATNPVQRLLDKAVQAKLTIGQPGDAYEQEADRVASQQAERFIGKGKSESPSTPGFDVASPITQSPTFAPVSENQIQRQCADCAKEEEEQKGKEKKDLEKNGIQTKLTIGEPGDAYEQEADRVASQVMSMSAPADSSASVQRSPEANNPNQIWQEAQSITPAVQTRIDSTVQMHQIDGNQASGDLENRLNASKGGGSPLSEQVRGFMEPRFGADFSSVRVHTGSSAVQMNQELGAQAFTHGSDVYFGAGKSPGNNELTAHELTHVVQQTGVVQRFVPDSSSVSLQTNSKLKVQRANTYKDCTPAQRTAIQDAFNRAIGKVNASVTAIQKAHSSHPKIDPNTKTLLNRHFHTTKKKHLKTILKKFRDIQSAFASGVKFKCETDCDSGVGGYVYYFLFWHLGRVHICFDLFNNIDPLTQEEVIIHEVAHRFAGVSDHAYVWEGDYSTLSPKKAMDNADSYANFAIQV